MPNTVESVSMPRKPKEINAEASSEPVRVTILYPPEVMERVHAIARTEGIAFTALLRQWTMQRLAEEERKRQ